MEPPCFYSLHKLRLFCRTSLSTRGAAEAVCLGRSPMGSRSPHSDGSGHCLLGEGYLLPWQGGTGRHTAAEQKGCGGGCCCCCHGRRGRGRGLSTGRQGRIMPIGGGWHRNFSSMWTIDPRAHSHTSQVLIHWRKAVEPRWVGALVHLRWWWLPPREWGSIRVMLHGTSSMPTCQAG